MTVPSNGSPPAGTSIGDAFAGSASASRASAERPATERVAVVTDSTASLPRELAAIRGVGVVQMQVQIDGHTDDESRVAMDDLLPALRGGAEVSTSPPDPGAFFWAYQDAIAAGATAIVSVHISTKQSTTAYAAQQAAASVGVPVLVVDSRTTGTSLGYAALSAAQAARAGGDAQAVARAALDRAQHSTALFYVDTLEYLRRGGRIGTASAWIGTALAIKPLLTVREGQVAPLAKARGATKAMRKLAATAVEGAPRGAVDIAVEHFDGEEPARQMLAELQRQLPEVNECFLTQTSATVGVHVGPGSLGVTISSA